MEEGGNGWLVLMGHSFVETRCAWISGIVANNEGGWRWRRRGEVNPFGASLSFAIWCDWITRNVLTIPLPWCPFLHGAGRRRARPWQPDFKIQWRFAIKPQYPMKRTVLGGFVPAIIAAVKRAKTEQPHSQRFSLLLENRELTAEWVGRKAVNLGVSHRRHALGSRHVEMCALKQYIRKENRLLLTRLVRL